MGSGNAARGVTLSAALLSASVSGAAQAGCAEGVVELRGDWGDARFRVEVADDPEERSLGLMNRAKMAESRGMLFVYPEAGSPSFWMKNTLIPLDMIFMAPDGTVTRVHENARPRDETPIPGGDGVQYVLEINGGMTSALGLEPGSEMRNPTIDQEIAAWPCKAP